MNREVSGREMRLQKKKKEIWIIGALALLLVVATWQVFGKTETSTALSMSAMSENEQKVCRILQQIEGVGEVSVMICETEEGVQSVVVVCDGAKDLQVVMDVREAVACAVGTSEKSVKIYLKK